MPAEIVTTSDQGSGLVPDQGPAAKPDKEPEIDIEALVKGLEAGIETRSTRKPLLSGATAQFEVVSSPIFTGINVHFGEEWTRLRIDAKIRQILEENPERSAAEKWVGPVGYTAGFGSLWRTPETHSREQVYSDTLEVAVELVKQLIEQEHLDPKKVDIVDFANSAMVPGMSDDLKQRLIDEVGMRVDIEVPGEAEACNGAGDMFLRRAVDRRSQGKLVFQLSVDPVTCEMPLDPTQVDTLSMQLFSNGAAVFAYRPGVDLRIITGTTGVYEDTEGVLTATPPYAAAIDAFDVAHPGHQGIIYQIGNDRLMKLPKPKPEVGGKGRMNGAHTAKFFWDIAEDNIRKTYEKYQKYCSKHGITDRDFAFASGHHPSYAVYRGLLHRFEKLKKIKGIDIKIPLEWVVPYGNSSGATSLISFVSNIPLYEHGKRGLYTSYGAGGGATSFVWEVL